ncbi:mannose-6-phosphate isomerase, class I [Microbacterium ulmi]|uniref:mannose-6-phosphate isomerase n=1 Tax=Microbacterium ulmi TaxID=179095 RepID=A0A7Y2LZ58_9MICO|nr:mannose-6-phosphate isomerase, class I [Microbacterium ulmi]NII70379.1 mannose-6-phosphate isomerase [Microbacterium ulmi]NNH03427.1 mannose-6-phosphate isomerase, class I [Microbacterium ulmi]
MLVPLSNSPRDYAWGSTTLIADLESRSASGLPEAEVWFGDHPGDPALVPDGRPLGEWLQAEGATTGAPARLPYLLKLLAAASPLSIQVHPSKEQAEAGFAREEAAGVPRDASHRLYRDDNHKPELIVAVSETFTALAGLRDLDATLRLLAALGEPAAPLARRLAGEDAATALRDAVAWLLSGDAQSVVDAVIAAVAAAHEPEFAAELSASRSIASAYPGDPGVVVALLMNLVVLRRGEGLFVPAGVLHAYLEGLGVELMAASDNVLRGGLTPKHIDVAELVALLDATPGREPRLVPAPVGAGVERFDAGVPDFSLLHASVAPDASATVRLDGVAIVLATDGRPEVRGTLSGDAVALTPGRAVLVSPDEGAIALSGSGEVFVAVPGTAIRA